MDLVIETDDRPGVESSLSTALGVQPIKSTKLRTFYPAGDKTPKLDVVFSQPGQFESHMLTWTGNSTFNIACRAKAKTMGMKLNEHGLWDGDKLVEHTESGILTRLGMPHHINPKTRSL